MEIDCQSRLEQNCELDPNCRRHFEKGKYKRCQRRNGVNGGLRYHFVNGVAVPIQGDLAAQDDFQFDPDDPQFNEPRDPKYIMERQYLGHGTYGIVFMPAFPDASGREYPSMIGKVFYDEKNAQDEWAMIQRINHLTGNLAYPIQRTFIPFPSNPSSGAEQNLLHFYKRNRDTSGAEVPKVLPQHLMRYYGVELSRYMDGIPPGSLSRADFIYILEKLFWGVKFLNENGIVHQDIKSQNIVISNKKGLRIVDFGWAILRNNYYNIYNEMLTLNYVGVSPPENSIFKFILENMTFDGLDYDKINNDFVLHYQGNYPILDPRNQKFITEFLDNLKKIVNQPINELKQILIKDHGFIEKKLKPFFNDLFKLRMHDKLENWKNYPELSIHTLEFIENILWYINKIDNIVLNYWKKHKIGKCYDIFSVGMVVDKLLQRDLLIDEVKDDPDIVFLFKELVAGITIYSPLYRLDPDAAYRIVQEIKRHKVRFEREQQVNFLKLKFPGITETEIKKKLPRRFPFKVAGEDTPRTKLRLQQFGTVNLKAINRDIFYLTSFK